MANTKKSFSLLFTLSLLIGGGFVQAAGVSISESELEVGTLGSSSCYTLTKITDETTITDKDFVVTKYLGDVSTGNLTPVRYSLDLISSANPFLSWSIDSNGNKILNIDDTIGGNSESIQVHYVDTYFGSGYFISPLTVNIGSLLKYEPEEAQKYIYSGDVIKNGYNYDTSYYIRSEVSVPGIEGEFIGSSGISNESKIEYINLFVAGCPCGIRNHGDIKNIEGCFAGNKERGISNGGKITNIRGEFIGNSSYGIINSGYIYDVQGDFIGNTSSSDGAAIQNRFSTTYYPDGTYTITPAEITNVRGNFIENHAYNYGGAIYNTLGYIANIRGDFVGNHALWGGAIYIASSIGCIENCNFVSNYSNKSGGAIFSHDDIKVCNTMFVNNHVTDKYVLDEQHYNNEFSGGAVYMHSASTFDRCIFAGNNITIYDYVHTEYDQQMLLLLGGAFFTRNSTNVSLSESKFVGNYIANLSETPQITATHGGALYAQVYSVTDLTNVTFSGNYIINNSFEYNPSLYPHSYAIYVGGGAISLDSSTVNFNVTKGRHIVNVGNFVELDGVKYDKCGGFLLMGSYSIANFNTEENSCYTIGDGSKGYDSIASHVSIPDEERYVSAIINKNGKGEVVVNSSMEFYKGTLNVNEGNMTVNNKLGASAVRIASGASLSAKVSDNGSTFTNAALNFSNDGTLNLVADETLASGNYEVFVFENPETVYFGNVKSYGGTFDHATGTFVVNDALNITIGETNSVNVKSNGRILAVGAGVEDTSIMMNFNSAADVTVNSVFDTSASDDGFAEIVGAVNQEDLLLAEAFAFDVENLGAGDTVSLSFFIGSGYDISQFTVYHKDAELGWELADISNLEYDGEYLSFIVDGFSSYGYVAAVPEPSTYATIIGAISLCLILSRRRN